jgi:solute:Na+ symporter, SSS family
MTNGLATADYIILGGFFVVMLGVGVFYAGRMHNLRDFFSGSRQVPWWLAGISLYMTTFSAFTFVSYSALAYQHGFVAVAIWWFSIPGCLLSAWFLASRWRRAATTSPVEYLETRFGPVLRQAFSWFGIPLIVLDDALKLFVIGTMVAVSMGFAGDPAVMWAIAACGLIMLTYTLLGGLWAVLITDFVQFVVMGIAVLVLAPLAWARAGGGTEIVAHLPAGFAEITSGAYTWAWLLSFAVILALTFATKWPYVQRYYAARSDREARWVGYLVAALTFVTPPLLFFPALAARAFLPEVADANQVYPLVCQALLPVGMMGIMLAAMFSATMSMLSSDYNAVASVVTNDILKRLFMRDASDKALVITARLATLFVGLLAMALAILFARAKGLEDLVQYMARLFAALLPPVALPMMAGLLSRRTSNAGALAGFFAGATCGIVAYVLSYQEGLDYLRTVPYLTWITLVPTAAGLILGSVLMPNSQRKQAVVAQFLEGLRRQPGEKVSLVASGDAAVALRIIGSTIALLGLILLLGVLATANVAATTISIVVGAIMIAGGVAAVAAARALAGVGEEAR